MKKIEIIKNLKTEIVNQLNGIIENVNDIDELRTVLRMILMFNQPGDIKEMLNCEPEDESDENQQTEFDGGDEIGDDHHDEGYPDEPDEDTLLEKVYNDTEPAHYNDTEPAKKPELPQGNPSGECWVITRSYGFIPDGPGYDITGDELVYGIYDSWEPAISEFRNIAERTGKDIDEGPDYYKITDWNPATGTAGYILKKHGVNGIRADEDEFCELLYAAAAESAALGMTAYLEGDRVALITEIANLVADITKNTEDAEKIFGLALTDNIRNALEVTEETLSKLTALMLKMK